jgi:hypothetical protein
MKKFPKTPFDRVKNLASFAPAILGGSILLLASIPPSHAAPVPKCVIAKDLKQGFFLGEDAVTVVNNCRGVQRVKVILSRAQDLGCFSIGIGGSTRVKWLIGGFDKLVSC